MRFVGGKAAVQQFFSEFFCFPLLINIPPLFHIYLSPLHDACDSPDQAAHYHTLALKLGASSLTRHLAGLGVMVVTLKIKVGKNDSI
jgi:hypothetical protein